MKSIVGPPSERATSIVIAVTMVFVVLVLRLFVLLAGSRSVVGAGFDTRLLTCGANGVGSHIFQRAMTAVPGIGWGAVLSTVESRPRTHTAFSVRNRILGISTYAATPISSL
jgi:hypothetical protein